MRQTSGNRSFAEFISCVEHVLAEGAIVERVKRDSGLPLNADIGYSAMIYQQQGREALEKLYREYLDIGCRYDLPFFALAPTWRANPERVAQSPCNDFETVNRDCVDFYRGIINGYGDYERKVYLAGLMACRGDAYQPAEALSQRQAIEFHRPQARALAAAGVDCIKAATLPAFSEAAGMANVFSDLQIDYVLSFVLRTDGCLLDGIPLEECIRRIDDTTPRPPVFYMVNCIHPTVLTKAAARLSDVAERIQGIQANTSLLTPEELDELDYLDEEDPGVYTRCLLDARQSLDLKIIGGCCGSDARHIELVAQRLRELQNRKKKQQSQSRGRGTKNCQSGSANQGL